jgi:hypothetical protein
MATFYSVERGGWGVIGVELTLAAAKKLGVQNTREGDTFTITADTIKVDAESIRLILGGGGYAEKTKITQYKVRKGAARATAAVVII